VLQTVLTWFACCVELTLMACYGAQGTGRRSIFIENQPAVLAGLFISEVCMPRGTESIYPMRYRCEWA
ncbi:hypothetical protein, partial [Salmonella enterica]|uniref:hypothetical protein n=1 Tax=Salmonella enterica TaxID=28901 RepID=UPI001C37774C